MSLRQISTILIGSLGIALLIFAIWVFSFVPYSSFAALMFGIGGLAVIAIAILVYRSTSIREVFRAIISWMLILAGIPPIVFALWSMLLGYAHLLVIISGILGVVISTLGWTLIKPKYPIGIAKKIISGICLTSGAGIVIVPIWILSIYGTQIVFANIAPIYVIAGVGLIVIGSLLRRSTKT